MPTAFVNIGLILNNAIPLKHPNTTWSDLAPEWNEIQHLPKCRIAFHMNLDPSLLTHSTRTIHQTN